MIVFAKLLAMCFLAFVLGCLVGNHRREKIEIEVETFLAMNERIVGHLYESKDPYCLYAAVYIEELQKQVAYSQDNEIETDKEED